MYPAGPSFPTAVPFASLKVAFLPVTHDSLFALRLRVDLALGLLGSRDEQKSTASVIGTCVHSMSAASGSCASATCRPVSLAGVLSEATSLTLIKLSA